MKNIILLTAILLFAGCKKEHGGGCKICAGETNQPADPNPWITDSTTFANWVIGKWYLKQRQFYPDDMECQSVCYTDTQYYVLFLPNHTIIRNLAGNHKDTVVYSCSVDTLDAEGTFGIFFPWTDSSAAPHDTTLCGLVQFSGNYLTLQEGYSYPVIGIIHFPCYAYGLTR